MKTKLIAAALAVSSLFSSAAFAHEQHAASPVYAYQGQGRHRGHGHYELQNVQRWVPGRYVSVPCHSGYMQQWQAGYYTTVQEWVWVEGRGRGHRFGRHGVDIAWR
jgi:hypothetical protein